MAASKTVEPATSDFDEADDLFAGETPEGDFDEADDLLNSVQEDDAEGWVPTERGETVSGVVTKVGETRSDFSDDMCPTVTVLTRSGDKYRIIGYGAVLKREMEDAAPKVGDIFAAKYWGEKILKKGKFAGKTYKHFSVAVKHKS